MKPREIKFKVLFGTDNTLKTDITFLDDCAFKPGEEFLMREVTGPDPDYEKLDKENQFLLRTKQLFLDEISFLQDQLKLFEKISEDRTQLICESADYKAIAEELMRALEHYAYRGDRQTINHADYLDSIVEKADGNIAREALASAKKRLGEE